MESNSQITQRGENGFQCSISSATYQPSGRPFRISKVQLIKLQCRTKSPPVCSPGLFWVCCLGKVFEKRKACANTCLECLLPLGIVDFIFLMPASQRKHQRSYKPHDLSEITVEWRAWNIQHRVELLPPETSLWPHMPSLTARLLQRHLEDFKIPI